MQLVSFAKSINYEKNRPFNHSFIGDVYDTPAWKSQTGESDPDSDYLSDGVFFICVYYLCDHKLVLFCL